MITTNDKKKLQRIIPRLDPDYSGREDVMMLAEELARAEEVAPAEVPPDVVTLNSTVRVTDLDHGDTRQWTVVMPGHGRYEDGKISVLAPLGTALLGYRCGDEIEWEVPGGRRRLRIDEVVFQPEAAGQYEA